VASSKDRQRKLARAKLERQNARRAVKERRRRRIYAGIGSGVAVLLIVAGVAWMGGAFDSKKSTTAADQDICAWTPQSATTNTNLKEVGTPPTKNIPVSGTETMTIKTDQGDPIEVSLDLTTAPCGSEDLRYLASKKFFDNTTCHEITTYGAIRCGDPTGTGLGGPTYSVYSENTPAAPTPSPSAAAGKAPQTAPLYPKGTVALIGNPPGTNGSQFLIFFKDYSPASPEYSIVGSVSGGMTTVEKIGKIPTVADDAGDKVKPKTKITIASLTVAQPAASTAATAAPSASAQS
jgi:peptidyl-prolyl cis-trans isomerase B (cyclophilin B)